MAKVNMGERIKLARKKAGMTQQQLADRAGITKQSISKYERGAASPGSAVLLRLSDALEVTLDFLIRPSSVTLGEVKFRQIRKLSARDRKRIEAEVADSLERQLILERIVLGAPRRYDGPRQIPMRTIEDAEQAADQLRKCWDLGTDPIADMTSLVEHRGVRVVLVTVEEDSDFEGLGQWIGDDIPAIAANAGRPGDRQRFTLAHELAHLLLHDVAGQGADFEEQAACRFAGALLIPAEAVVASLGESRTWLSLEELCGLKHLYGVSMQCLMHRAQECAIIDDKTYTQLRQYFRKNKWETCEPDDQVAPEQPRLAEQLLGRAVAEDYISETRAAELASRSLDEYRQHRRRAAERLAEIMQGTAPGSTRARKQRSKDVLEQDRSSAEKHSSKAG